MATRKLTIAEQMIGGLGMVWRYCDQAARHRKLRRAGVNIARSAIVMRRYEIYGNVTIGESSLVDNSLVDGRGTVVIGSKTIVLSASIVTAQHDLDSPTFATTYGPVEIGDYAVLFPGALVLPGRKVGRGAVVASHAVVTRDVPDMAIVVGNPARVARMRAAVHDEADIRRMVGFVLHLLPGRLLGLASQRSAHSSQ